MDLSGTKAEGIEDAVDPDIMFVFKMMLGSVKRSYEKRVGDIKVGSFHGGFLSFSFPSLIHFLPSHLLVTYVVRFPFFSTNLTSSPLTIAITSLPNAPKQLKVNPTLILSSSSQSPTA